MDTKQEESFITIKSNNMCTSGIHYIEEVEEKNVDTDIKIDKKLICQYSGLPSIMAYASEDV